MPRPTAQDLAGFWDLLQLSVDDVTAKFEELQKIKRNEWRTVEEPEEKASALDHLYSDFLNPIKNSLSFHADCNSVCPHFSDE